MKQTGCQIRGCLSKYTIRNGIINLVERDLLADPEDGWRKFEGGRGIISNRRSEGEEKVLNQDA